MAIGYCAKCQQPLLPGGWSMSRGKKYCNSCLGIVDVKSKKVLDQEKQNFFRYLLSLFPDLSVPPESWNAAIESMSKRGWSIKNIQNTIVYCGQQGKEVNSDNWSQLVFVYYNEAVKWVDHLREIQQKNREVDLTPKVVALPFKSTTYRDMPDYKIEDL